MKMMNFFLRIFVSMKKTIHIQKKFMIQISLIKILNIKFLKL